MISIIDSDELKYVLRPTVFLRCEPRTADRAAPDDRLDTNEARDVRRISPLESDRVPVEAS
jgi:hypothetical protein